MSVSPRAELLRLAIGRTRGRAEYMESCEGGARRVWVYTRDDGTVYVKKQERYVSGESAIRGFGPSVELKTAADVHEAFRWLDTGERE